MLVDSIRDLVWFCSYLAFVGYLYYLFVLDGITPIFSLSVFQNPTPGCAENPVGTIVMWCLLGGLGVCLVVVLVLCCYQSELVVDETAIVIV